MTDLTKLTNDELLEYVTDESHDGVQARDLKAEILRRLEPTCKATGEVTDYDKDKVSPRPWYCDLTANIWDVSEGFVTGLEDDSPLEDGIDTYLHIVHCVNEHDRLQALANMVQKPDGSDGELVKALTEIIIAGEVDERTLTEKINKAVSLLAHARKVMESGK